MIMSLADQIPLVTTVIYDNSTFIYDSLYGLVNRETIGYTDHMMKYEKKTTNEKPVSLTPLDFKEALAALLKVKPKPKEEEDKPKKKQKKSSD